MGFLFFFCKGGVMIYGSLVGSCLVLENRARLLSVHNQIVSTQTFVPLIQATPTHKITMIAPLYPVTYGIKSFDISSPFPPSSAVYSLNSIPISSGDHGRGRLFHGSDLLKHPKPSKQASSPSNLNQLK